jgi:hypothetical protein
MYLNVHTISYHIVILCFVFSGGSPTCRTTYEGTQGGLRSDLKGSVTSAHLCSSCVLQIHTVYLILILILIYNIHVYICMYICTHYTLLSDDKLHNHRTQAICCQILLLLPFVAGLNLHTTLTRNILALFCTLLEINST